jgi:hypothetical protein
MAQISYNLRLWKTTSVAEGNQFEIYISIAHGEKRVFGSSVESELACVWTARNEFNRTFMQPCSCHERVRFNDRLNYLRIVSPVIRV